MTGDLAIQLGRDALMMVMLIAAPVLGLGMIVGIVISVFQATTQIQEQTLAFIPKIIAVFVSIVIFGPWMLHMMVDYVSHLFNSLPQLIR